MGRKIPAKKHRGVKDPVKQQEQRLLSLKTKINAPPSHPDDQPVPKSFTRLFEFKDRHEKRIEEKKTKQKPKVRHRSAESDDDEAEASSLKTMRRLPGESNRSFMLRINNALQSINKRELQTVEMKKSQNPDDYVTDEDENAKEERYDFIKRQKLKRKMKRQKNENGEEAAPKLTKIQKLNLRKKLKKEKLKEQQELDFKPRYETIQFGEIAHEPPSLHIKPRKAQSIDGAPRPGRKDLLLNKLLLGDSDKSNANNAKVVPKITAHTKNLTFDKKAKRKELPIAVRLKLEQSQKEAIDAYRALKKQHAKS